jgi:hypothetical protein
LTARWRSRSKCYPVRIGKDAAAVVLDVLSKSLAEVQARTRAAQVLEEIFARPVPPPFDAMTEEEVMQMVEQEIALARSEGRSLKEG